MKYYQQLRQDRMTLKKQSQQMTRRNAELVIEKYDLEKKLCQCRESKEVEYDSLSRRYRIEVMFYTVFLMLTSLMHVFAVTFELPLLRPIADVAVLVVIVTNGFRFIFAKTI